MCVCLAKRIGPYNRKLLRTRVNRRPIFGGKKRWQLPRRSCRATPVEQSPRFQCSDCWSKPYITNQFWSTWLPLQTSCVCFTLPRCLEGCLQRCLFSLLGLRIFLLYSSKFTILGPETFPVVSGNLFYRSWMSQPVCCLYRCSRGCTAASKSS